MLQTVIKVTLSLIAVRNGKKKHRPYAQIGSNRPSDQRFKSMKLLRLHRVTDAQGVWYSVERRQCQWTGLTIERTKRITR